MTGTASSSAHRSSARGVWAGAAVLLLASQACASPKPNADSALWADQYAVWQQEQVRLTDRQRDLQAWNGHVRIVRDVLAQERQRLSSRGACPGPQVAFTASPSDALRDGMRPRLYTSYRGYAEQPGPRSRRQAVEEALLGSLQATSLADWNTRQAAAKGDPGMCAAFENAMARARTLDERASTLLGEIARGGSDAADERVVEPLFAVAASGGTEVAVAVRPDAVEALPLYFARSRGLDRAQNLALRIVTADEPARVSSPAVVALRSDRPDEAGLQPIVSLFDRQPYGAVSKLAAGGLDLAGQVVVQSTAGVPLPSGTAGAAQVIPADGWLGPLALYGSGQVDALVGKAPLPQYAAVAERGAVVWDGTDRTAGQSAAGEAALYAVPSLDTVTRDRLAAVVRQAAVEMRGLLDEALAEQVAPDYLAWEMDAVLEAAKVAKRALDPATR